ncbi:predicted protein [Plenodomus lingam JN3]|uniref:Predicted protein n=1 Tax=Leptosphaeria maculans (strain JN3 / isolate v23.1.3 / race Av1-4-5-6-7-8) TaxID=985895 RepID=E5R4H5_LEPMJ|nr:predicted protein [Plenodomus lingam JN3]CBX91943.1 predicted protein [Plenodomus lingam JN3]
MPRHRHFFNLCNHPVLITTNACLPIPFLVRFMGKRGIVKLCRCNR